MDHRLITISAILTMSTAGTDACATTITINPTVPTGPTITINPTVPTGPTITIDPIISTDSASCVIPFTRAGNLILIQAKADTTTGFFVLDTGTPGLVLNLTYFRHYPTSNPVESGGVTGSTLSAQTTVDSFRLGPISYRHVDADLVNLGHIENNKGVKIFGLIGLQLLERFEMIIDYSSNRLYLHLISKKEAATYRSPQLLDSASYTIIPIDIEEHKMIVYLFLKGRKLKFIIDTAAETNVLDSRLPGKVFEQVEITRRVTLNGSGNHKVEALVGDLKGLRLGNLDIGALPVLITNLQSMCDAYNNCLDGMLGFDFLSLHKIGFNFVNRKMYIWK
jgi:Aspartyl protease